MKYADKVKRESYFYYSLNGLLNFAYASPVLSLQKRRALVEIIQSSGSLTRKCKVNRIQTPSSLSYQRTRAGLLRICLDKMISYPETTKDLRWSICKIAALSAWAGTNPNRSSNIFDDFARKMCPEDCRGSNSLYPTEAISRNFHAQLKKDLGLHLAMDKISDLLFLSSNLYYKKYTSK